MPIDETFLPTYASGLNLLTVNFMDDTQIPATEEAEVATPAPTEEETAA